VPAMQPVDWAVKLTHHPRFDLLAQIMVKADMHLLYQGCMLARRIQKNIA
jgi:hypothetical protein